MRTVIVGLVLVVVVVVGFSTAQADEIHQVYAPMALGQDAYPAVQERHVVGCLVEAETGVPYAFFPMRLAEIHQTAYVLDLAFDPGAITDENGCFDFTIPVMFSFVNKWIVVAGWVDQFFLHYEILDTIVTVPNGAVVDLGIITATLSADPWGEWDNGNLIIK